MQLIGKKVLHLTEISVILSRKYPSAYLYNQYKAIHKIEWENSIKCNNKCFFDLTTMFYKL